MSTPASDEIDALYARLDREAEESGYHLNPDGEFTRDLVAGLLVNRVRYGYMSCPCRLASGRRDDDLDIVCPCDYRDPDLDEFGACYCALYVSGAVKRGDAQARPIPERRPPPEERAAPAAVPGRPAPAGVVGDQSAPYPIWRCRVCGYLCAREHPPEVCPICKAKKERFERFV